VAQQRRFVGQPGTGSVQLSRVLVEQKQEERRVAPALGGKGGCLGDAVNPLAVFATYRIYRQTHLLAQRAADESAKAVRLPAGCFMIWVSVAPPLRWSRPRTSAFLLPSRATPDLSPPLACFPLAALAFVAGFAFLPCFPRAFGLLAHFGAVVAASVALPSRLWIAFQMRATADLRLVDFLTGVRPGMPFQTSISRLAGQVAARSASS
jgi:hypothetical protein